MIERLKNHKPNILVIGDLMLDNYLWGKCDRISPEAPVQVVDVKEKSSVLGGAGNVINNLKALGSDVSIISVVGNDDVGQELIDHLKKLEIDHTKIVKENGRRTTSKSRIIASNQQIIRLDNEDRFEISSESQAKILQFVKEALTGVEIAILSDYGKGVLTNHVTSKLLALASEKNIKVLVDPKGSDYAKYSGAYLLTPNKKEASMASGIDIKNNDDLLKAHKYLKSTLNLNHSIITLSEDGVSSYSDKLSIIPTVAREIFDVTGAGDTVIASLAFGLSAQLNITDALIFSNYAAGVVVGKVGSSTASLDEIEEYISSIHKSNSFGHIKSFDEINKLVLSAKQASKKIVFTNGCFDILHYGHVKYLEVAKSFGDILIVGLNSDESVKRLKGETRPINVINDRAYLLAALEVVDYVVPFEEDTPYELLNLIRPHILVKGGDYKNKEIIGSDLVNEIKLVEFVDGKSTTSIIDKIKKENH